MWQLNPEVNKDLRHFSVPYSLDKYSLDKASSMGPKSSRPIWQLDPRKTRPTRQLDLRDNSPLVTTRHMRQVDCRDNSTVYVTTRPLPASPITFTPCTHTHALELRSNFGLCMKYSSHSITIYIPLYSMKTVLLYQTSFSVVIVPTLSICGDSLA